jgi:hypothetical protein
MQFQRGLDIQRAMRASGRPSLLKVQGQHVVHHGWFAKIGARDELGLLGGGGGSIDQNVISQFSPDVSWFSVFENIDDQPDLAVVTVTGFAGFAIRKGQADQPGRGNGGSLGVHLRKRRYQK